MINECRVITHFLYVHLVELCGSGIQGACLQVGGTGLTDGVSACEGERKFVETVEGLFTVGTGETVPEG